VPPDVAELRRWTAGTRRSLAPVTLDGVHIQAVPWLGPPRPLSYASWGWWMSPSLHVALDRLRAEWPFDVLHAHCLAPAGHAAALWMARRRDRERPTFVVSGHGPDLTTLADGAVGRRAVRQALDAADLVLANSTWTRRRCEALAGHALAIEVVHLGATLAAPGDERAGDGDGDRDGDAGRRLRVITVAHLQERKHHHVVLRALACLPEPARPDYLIVGAGEQRERLERLTDELGLRARVRFAGQLPNEQAVARVAQSDLFVMPGVEEPFGVAFVEALAAGVPAVGSRGQGGPEDIATAGEGMLLVGDEDAPGLAALIARLDGDRSELARLGRAARATAMAHFTWERCGERTVAAYARALASRRS
jgi:glycosyltransferase involved in cell wall biosynthesis